MEEGVSRYNARNPDHRVLYLNCAALATDLTEEKCDFWHFRFAANVTQRVAAIGAVRGHDGEAAGLVAAQDARLDELDAGIERRAVRFIALREQMADDLGADVARHLRPWEPTTPGQGQRHGRSPGEVAIAWVLRLPAVTGAIVGARSAEQVEGWIGAGDFRLTEAEIREIDALLKLRSDLNAKSAKDGPGAFKLSVNDLIIKAAAITLRRGPKVNASYTEDGIVLYDDVDISVAVSIPDGLITPIIRKADQKGLAAISNEMKGLAERAKSGKLKPEEFQGGGFSISNMGMYGVSDFAAVINPPQAAILAVAAGQQRPVVKDGQLAVATMMTCTLSVDHRVVDGALAAEWLGAFKSVVEEPLSLML